jgi:hyperosmotically inducible periplasmic protein
MFHARHRTFMRSTLFGGLLTLAVGTAHAQTPPSSPPPAQPPAPTASQQPAATPDDVMAARIRKAIKDEKAIAIYAESIKVIVSSGTVSLKGPVRTDADKKAIGAKADAIAGEANVMNNLVVAPDSPNLPKPTAN